MRIPNLSLPFVVLLAVWGNAPLNGQTKAARQHLERAEELEADNGPGAEREYRLALQAMRGRYPDALRALSHYLARCMRFSEAAEALSNYIRQTPSERHLDDIEELGDLKRAAKLTQAIRASNRPPVRDLVEYSTLVSRYASVKHALPYAERAVELYPNSAEAQLELASALVGTDPDERRCNVLRRAIGLGARSPSTFLELANCELITSHTQEAADAFQEALELTHGNLLPAWEGLILALSRLGRREDAAQAFSAYLSKIPEEDRAEVGQRLKGRMEKLEKDQ
jgi:predicted Zn-dependent protease